MHQKSPSGSFGRSARRRPSPAPSIGPRSDRPCPPPGAGRRYRRRGSSAIRCRGRSAPRPHGPASTHPGTSPLSPREWWRSCPGLPGRRCRRYPDCPAIAGYSRRSSRTSRSDRPPPAWHAGRSAPRRCNCAPAYPVPPHSGKPYSSARPPAPPGRWPGMTSTHGPGRSSPQRRPDRSAAGYLCRRKSPRPLWGRPESPDPTGPATANFPETPSIFPGRSGLSD